MPWFCILCEIVLRGREGEGMCVCVLRGVPIVLSITNRFYFVVVWLTRVDNSTWLSQGEHVEIIQVAWQGEYVEASQMT